MTAIALAVPSGAAAKETTEITSTTTSTSTAAPVVERIFPSHGSASRYTPVLIAGQNLSSSQGFCLFFMKCNVSVHVGEKEAFVFFDSHRYVIILAPPAEKGTVDVTVTVSGVTSETTPADRFTYE